MSSKKAKSVCVIGAGPSGLVAAKNLASAGIIVTILEAKFRIGGLWPIQADEDGGLVNPDMCTNQSMHTVAFSDLAWSSVFGEEAQQFPKAWCVGRYLERYRERFGIEVELGKRVVRCEQLGGGEEGWVVNVEGEEVGRRFDHLIVASGFFGSPRICEEARGAGKDIPVLHSSMVRDMKSLLGTARGEGRNILVVGGQMSGFEMAASLALQLSSLTHSPGESGVEDVSKYQVVHVVQKPTWIMPLFYPKDPDIETVVDGQTVKSKNPAPTFLPLDLVVYNIGWRPPGPVLNTSGHITAEAAQQTADFMQTYIGHDQSDLDIPALAIQGDARSEPPMLAVSDHYHELVRHGKIKVVQGRLSKAYSDTSEILTLSGDPLIIQGLVAIVCATGFDATSSLDFLPRDVLEKLNFQPNQEQSFPLELDVHSAINKSIPTLGFVGFYRSPYWGVMEMQARFLAKLWSGDTHAQHVLDTDISRSTLKSLRTDLRKSQFPMGDYVYLMESFSSFLSIQRSEPSNNPEARTGLVLPPRYLLDNARETEQQEAKTALQNIDALLSSSATSARFVPRAVFRGLQGIWTLSRVIKSQISTFPSGSLEGTAEFHPRAPTLVGKDMEYLYFEEGDFSPSWGGTMRAKRSYVWHYTEGSDSMDVWFAKMDGKSADYFFHELVFVVQREEGRGWRAKSSHLCVEDMYEVTYEFFFRGAWLERWNSRYEVKGPKKDYVIENSFTRPTRVES